MHESATTCHVVLAEADMQVVCFFCLVEQGDPLFISIYFEEFTDLMIRFNHLFASLKIFQRLL